ncbi:dihydrolipoamide acetyltransferase family protein [Wenzhouxiangella sediminis]|uniref:Dihydrolipoamide acetyltransferase component of pyruvate dehydrogenase complex n=1 Tax=Wenzhouxiangella sediminis TaxID=1792836 RepID=A0A3E1KBJ1_9GAMM|nr:dihydrolipoamide acetyltransferase family protein [Wenzhouxiangella sediminis]RFF31972.1 2-oxo acid dehydrogenase subunit E2 [Wenzhouxiangella sediminis]
MSVFNLPDLGEGLPDAEIVEWLVSEGDEVEVDQPLVSMETAKAVVEVPSPFDGKVTKFHGGPGDVIKTGAPLAEFEVAGEAGKEASTQDEPPATEAAAEDEKPAEASAEASAGEQQEEAGKSEEREDSGTVVGKMQAGGEVLKERTSTVGGVKVTPAVRALARKLKVDLSQVSPSGADGVVTAADVRKAAEEGTAPAQARREQPAASKPEPEFPAEPEHESKPASPAPSSQPAASASGEWEPLRGTRRTMARTMSESQKRVVPTTLMDDADIHAWRAGEDVTFRLLRALAAGAKAEPGLNAWYDDEQNMRMVHKGMDVGMAVDTADGLFVARLKGVHKGSREDIRGEINRLKENVKNRSIPPEDLKDYTIMLSNFGVFAGRYATPIINPPCVSIVAAGVLRHEVVPVLGGVEVHRMIPLSLTFDHRTVTGGEAARFLKAMIADLSKAE